MINARLDAIDDFATYSEEKDMALVLLRKFPDLERIIARIHTGNCLVKDFVAALNCFESITSLYTVFANKDLKSSRLTHIVSQNLNETLAELLNHFKASFDYDDAIQSGKISLFEGHDEEYDELKHNVSLIEGKLQSYRKDCEKSINCRISFKDIGKEIYQLEVAGKTKTPKDWIVMSKTKDVNRYYTSKLRDLVSELQLAQERCEMAKRNTKLKLYQRFDGFYEQW